MKAEPATLGRFPALVGLKSTATLDVVPRLSLLLLLIVVSFEVSLLLAAPVAIAILNRKLYRSPVLWLVVAAGLAFRNVIDWHATDNHHYLVNYWFLALGLAFLTTKPERSLALSARLLVGFVFLFAGIWKVTSGEFMDGAFFHHAILTDDRFEALARWGGGLSADDYAGNVASVARLEAPDATITTVTLTDTARVVPIARVMTAWGSWFELLVAAAFLAPSGSTFVRRARHVTVLAFCLTTYFVVPVTLFGMTLMTLGYATAPPASRARPLYLIGFAALPLYTLIWHAVTGLA